MHSIRSLAATGLATLVLIGGGCASAPAEAPRQKVTVAPIEGFVAYDQMADWKVKYQVPKTWTKDEEKNAEDLTVAFYAPDDGPNDTYQENIILTALPVPQDIDISLKEFAQTAHEGLGQTVEGLTTTDEGEVKMSGFPARKYSFAGTLNYDGVKLKVKGVQYFVIANNIGYQFTFGAAQSQYDKYLPTAEKIFGSVELE